MIDCGEPNFDAGYRLTEASGQRIADLEIRAEKAELERDALRGALREMVSVLADYVNDEDPTLLRARAALEAKP